jgi:hypothetical protein
MEEEQVGPVVAVADLFFLRAGEEEAGRLDGRAGGQREDSPVSCARETLAR